MNEIQYTLITDGPSDRALIPILTWVLHKNGDVKKVQSEWADLSRLPEPPKNLCNRILRAIDLYPCDLIFIHRDAEKEEMKTRYMEIQQAIYEAASNGFHTPAICVVPVRMTESWLLFDEKAIRFAAGNPNGKQALKIPELSQIENIPNPKDILFDLLKEASGLTGRRLKKFSPGEARVRISELITDFSPLRILRAFQHLEKNISLLKHNNWHMV
ncbi:MAG: DUF4276 family protein [Deltaproteobacteria bacterium]|nr:DUF4276 family protein [Deltaproteobacteria bacterium]